MGLDPRIFGPSFWGALHLACFAADHPDKVRQFIELYQYVLPCPGCRAHFAKVLVEYPVPDTTSATELFEWSVLVHNVVNRRIGKPEITSDEEIMDWVGKKIMEFENDARPKPPYVTMAIGFILVILLILFLKFNRT
jgi:hypothetical protein